jgi:hypothetical protein
MPSDVPSQNGERAARAAARKYGLVRRDDPTGYLDARHRSNGSPVQIKSALYERADGPGVFRVWREHLEDLADAGGSVVVVVVNPSNPSRQVLKVSKVSPSTLLERGDFRPTGQADMKGLHEARLRWREVVDL